MSYSGQYLYNALSYDELAQLFVDAYNENFNTSYTPEDLQNTELGTIISIFIQISYQTELAAGGLKDSLIQYLQNKQELEVLPKNATRSGISNSILALDFITAVSEEDPNVAGSTLTAGQCGIAVEYAEGGNTAENNIILAQTLIDGGVLGIEMVGDIEQTVATTTSGQSYTAKWREVAEVELHIKLFFKYDRNYTGNRILGTDIIENYVNRWAEVYVLGHDVLPLKYNDLSYYPSLAYLNSQFSIDGGSNYLPLNEIIESNYYTKYTIKADNITVTEE